MDFLTAIGGIAVKAVGISALKSYYNKQKEKVRWAIEQELRDGDFSRVHEDDLIAIYFRLYHAAIEGTAKNNLRLMARLICGLNEKNKLTATSFQRYSKILADLSEAEVQFLAELYNELKKPNCSEKEIMEKIRSEKGHILFGLIRTGFLIPFQPVKGTPPIASDINLWLPSPKLKELYSLWNWEDVAHWTEDND